MLLLEHLVLLSLAVPATLSCFYLLALTLASARLPLPPRSTRQLRFHIVVPAHNESSGIEATVRSLRPTTVPVRAWRP